MVILKRGSKDKASVSALKQDLMKLGYGLGDEGSNQGIFGPKVEAAVSDFQDKHGLKATGVVDTATAEALARALGGQVTVPSTGKPSWYTKAKEFNGKKETDSKFNYYMSSMWFILGLKLGTIAKNWAAWCGLAMAVSLYLSGYEWQKNGAAAVNWMKYGNEIEWKVNGIPAGAILQLNHAFKCGSSSNNHVTQANGDCAPQDLIDMEKGADGVWRPTTNPPRLKKGAKIDGYGGNQGNTWKNSTYDAREICAVRWPGKKRDGTRVALPPPVTKSLNCSGLGPSGESTR